VLLVKRRDQERNLGFFTVYSDLSCSKLQRNVNVKLASQVFQNLCVISAH